MDYTVPIQFNIASIFKKDPCTSDFELLLEWCSDSNINQWWNQREIEACPILLRNLKWLESKGFIKYKAKYKWANIYSDNKFMYVHDTREEAIMCACSSNFVCTIELKPKYNS